MVVSGAPLVNRSDLPWNVSGLIHALAVATASTAVLGHWSAPLMHRTCIYINDSAASVHQQKRRACAPHWLGDVASDTRHTAQRQLNACQRCLTGNESGTSGPLVYQ